MCEARWGLQPQRLRFVCPTKPAKLQNVTDGITNPVRLRVDATDMIVSGICFVAKRHYACGLKRFI